VGPAGPFITFDLDRKRASSVGEVAAPPALVGLWAIRFEPDCRGSCETLI